MPRSVWVMQLSMPDSMARSVLGRTGTPVASDIDLRPPQPPSDHATWPCASCSTNQPLKRDDLGGQ